MRRRLERLQFCIECGIRVRPKRKYELLKYMKYCGKCRIKFYREWHEKYRKPYLQRLSPAKRKKLSAQSYEAWKKWVQKNAERRREIARAYYKRHKRKRKNYQKRYYQREREKILEYQRKYRERSRQKEKDAST